MDSITTDTTNAVISKLQISGERDCQTKGSEKEKLELGRSVLYVQKSYKLRVSLRGTYNGCTCPGMCSPRLPAGLIKSTFVSLEVSRTTWIALGVRVCLGANIFWSGYLLFVSS